MGRSSGRPTAIYRAARAVRIKIQSEAAFRGRLVIFTRIFAADPAGEETNSSLVIDRPADDNSLTRSKLALLPNDSPHTGATVARTTGKKASTSKPSAHQWAIEAARLAEDRNAEEILVLDLRQISGVTDYFVIATGTSDRQLVAICDELERRGKTAGNKAYRVAGRDTGEWIVLDFVDVVVHLFNESMRSYYDLELIWGEADRVDWRRDAKSPPAGT
jgi:ribosome-associated protein